MSFYDYYQKMKTMQINNVQTNGNWALTPIDHVEQGVRQEFDVEPQTTPEGEYKFNPENGYVPDAKEQLTLPAFTAYQPKN